MNPGALCWVLNLDAEHELETVGAYTPSAHMRSVVAAQQRKLLGTLLGPDDILLTEANLDGYTESGALRGLSGLAWCPTPRALSMLDAVGAIPESAPSVDILRRVNARPFASEVRAPRTWIWLWRGSHNPPRWAGWCGARSELQGEDDAGWR